MQNKLKAFTTAEFAILHFCPGCSTQEKYVCYPIHMKVITSIDGQFGFSLTCAFESRREGRERE
jgi:hypothetical protein